MRQRLKILAQSFDEQSVASGCSRKMQGSSVDSSKNGEIVGAAVGSNDRRQLIPRQRGGNDRRPNPLSFPSSASAPPSPPFAHAPPSHASLSDRVPPPLFNPLAPAESALFPLAPPRARLDSGHPFTACQPAALGRGFFLSAYGYGYVCLATRRTNSSGSLVTRLLGALHFVTYGLYVPCKQSLDDSPRSNSKKTSSLKRLTWADRY